MLVLASKSPTRKALLENAGLRFALEPAQIDERALEASLPDATDRRAVAVGLAEHKALAVSAARPHDLVIGADQTLECEGREIHKPATLAYATAQLAALAGRTHALHAGVALAREGRVLWTHVQSARLTMKPFTRAELEAVLALEGERVLTSVGGYRLEGPSIRLFERIEGDYFTILGLPLLALLSVLGRIAPESL
ncbi:Maf family protein [Pelagibacterium montanilacus]|uniref:Maf family protein n=1 Tax=Pelagibacterium montanilacus TaxID=2185280 RepID=UPI000F8DD857|nr:Maf family protein [Pelagibacterium montanilacus]